MPNHLSRTRYRVACHSGLLDGIATFYLVSPPAGTEVLSSAGQTVQYKAIGTYQQGNHPATTEDVTSAVTWSSSNTAVATVSSSGVVTAVGSGKAIITATGNGASGILSGSSDVTVALSSTSGARMLTSIAIVPTSASLAQVGETVQYLAIGTYSSAPATQDLTSQVTWGASDVSVARIDAAGLATAVGPGTTAINAIYTPTASSGMPNPATISASASFSTSINAGTLTLATLAVYKVGANASSGSVTATYILPGGTSTVQAVNCAPGASGSTCTGNIPLGVTVTLTTTTTSGFGGWSSNCTLVPGNPYSCTVVVPSSGASNVAIGAIFS